MSDNQETKPKKTVSKQSWYRRTLGRSFISILFGNFFEKKNNTAGIIAILLIGTLCYTLIYQLTTLDGTKDNGLSTSIEILSNVIFVVIGYYFGAKQGAVSKDADED